MTNLIAEEAYSFDDVLLLPSYSDILPKDVDTRTPLTRELNLNIPIVSAAMDTVTGAQTAITMAREGGIGFIHRNMSIKHQAMEVDQVKKSESGMIVDPLTIDPDRPIEEVMALMARYRISGVPVTRGDQLVGIVTNRDLRFETDMTKRVSDVMTRENLVTVSEGISLEESKKLLHTHRIEKLLVVDKGGRLTGMITIKDIEKIKKYPNACKDAMGRLRVGAAVGVGPDMMPRAEALLKAGADVIVIDTSHGHSGNVIRGGGAP
jgi:IMP dehydrogenase